MIKILHVAETVKGGIATYLNEINKYQQADESLKICMLIPKEQILYINPVGIRIFFFKGGRTTKRLIAFSKHVISVIRSVKPDIVYAHSTIAGLVVRLLYPFYGRNIKIIYCSHGWAFSRSVSPVVSKLVAIIEWALSRITDVIINISEFDHNEAIRIGISQEKCVLIEHGISEERYTGKNIRLENESRINLLFVGRLDYQKGIDILLEQYEKVANDKMHLYVIGDSVVSDLELDYTSHVTFVGWLEHNTVLDYYHAVDVLVVPSRWEGFGLVVLEAMRAGVAVIASNRGALPKIVQNGKTGIIFNLDEKDSLSSILGALDKNMLRRMGELGRRRYLAFYTAESMNKKLMAVYRSLVAASHNG